MSSVKEIIQAIAKEVIPVQVVLCKVKSVDKDKCIIDAEPVGGTADMLEVRLKAIITDSNTGIILFPKKDTMVLVGLIGNNINQAFVVMMNEVEEAKLTLEGNEVLLDKDNAKIKWKQIEFNGGNNKGLVIVGNTVTEFNTIQKDINSLKQIFATWTPVSQDGGAALKTAVSTWAGQQLTETKQSDLENTKITH